MTSILGYADLTLMDGDLQDQQINYLNRIRDTVRRMELLVSDLADISRIESELATFQEREDAVGTARWRALEEKYLRLG